MSNDTLTPIDPTSSPLYQRVITRITQGLARGEWKSGESIPTEIQLAQQFEVSIGTIRKAIDELVAEKILIRQQGRGTFVATHTEDRYLYHFFHIVGADGIKHFPEIELLSFKKQRAGADKAERLKIDRGAQVIQIQNLVKLAGQPVALDDLTLPVALFPGLNADIFRSRPGTVYHLYQERYSINVIRTVERLSAISVDLNNAATLGLRKGAPALGIDRVAYSYDNLPVEIRKSQVNTEAHAYLNELGKNF